MPVVAYSNLCDHAHRYGGVVVHPGKIVNVHYIKLFMHIGVSWLQVSTLGCFTLLSAIMPYMPLSLLLQLMPVVCYPKSDAQTLS